MERPPQRPVAKTTADLIATFNALTRLLRETDRAMSASVGDLPEPSAPAVIRYMTDVRAAILTQVNDHRARVLADLQAAVSSDQPRGMSIEMLARMTQDVQAAEMPARPAPPVRAPRSRPPGPPPQQPQPQQPQQPQPQPQPRPSGDVRRVQHPIVPPEFPPPSEWPTAPPDPSATQFHRFDPAQTVIHPDRPPGPPPDEFGPPVIAPRQQTGKRRGRWFKKTEPEQAEQAKGGPPVRPPTDPARQARMPTTGDLPKLD